MSYSQLSVTKISRRKWRVLQDWHTPFGKVPAGFVTDGASVPRLLWAIFSPAGVLFEAAILHDYLYSHAINTKAFADHAFKQAALHYNAKPIEAKVAYRFVAWFGKGKY